MHRPPEEEIFTVTKDRDHMVIGKILKYICYRLRLIVTRLKVLTHVKRKANIKRLRSSINCKVTLLHAPTIIMQHEKTIYRLHNAVVLIFCNIMEFKFPTKELESLSAESARSSQGFHGLQKSPYD